MTGALGTGLLPPVHPRPPLTTSTFLTLPSSGAPTPGTRPVDRFPRTLVPQRNGSWRSLPWRRSSLGKDPESGTQSDGKGCWWPVSLTLRLSTRDQVRVCHSGSVHDSGPRTNPPTPTPPDRREVLIQPPVSLYTSPPRLGRTPVGKACKGVPFPTRPLSRRKRCSGVGSRLDLKELSPPTTPHVAVSGPEGVGSAEG